MCVCNVFGHISLVYRIHLRFKFHQYPCVMYIVTSNCVAVFWLLPFKFECSKCFGGNKKLSSGIHQLCKSDVCQLLAVPPRGFIFFVNDSFQSHSEMLFVKMQVLFSPYFLTRLCIVSWTFSSAPLCSSCMLAILALHGKMSCTRKPGFSQLILIFLLGRYKHLTYIVCWE